jgi:hypothetical protein
MSDGFGPSMVLVNPLSNPDPLLGSNWKASANSGGTPGTGVEKPFPANPQEDLDSDGLNALAEYFFGTSDDSENENPVLATFVDGEVLLTFPRDPAATAAQAVIELSDDLITWEEDPASITAQASGALDDSRALDRYSVDQSSAKKFVRVRIVRTP